MKAWRSAAFEITHPVMNLDGEKKSVSGQRRERSKKCRTNLVGRIDFAPIHDILYVAIINTPSLSS